MFVTIAVIVDILFVSMVNALFHDISSRGHYLQPKRTFVRR